MPPPGRHEPREERHEACEHGDRGRGHAAGVRPGDGQAAWAADIGVIPKKLIVVDKLTAASKAKLVYVSKDHAAGITKGSGTDVAQISVQFDVVDGDGSTAGAFTMSAGALSGSAGWTVNKPTVAKYMNKDAQSGPTQAKG